MGTQAQSQHSYTLDADKILHDGAVLAADSPGEIATVEKVVDFGATASGTSVENTAFGKYDMVVDVRAVESGTADEGYQFIFQLSDTADFTGVVVNRAVVSVGVDGGLLATSGADDDYALGRRVVGVDNEHAGTIYRYGRVLIVIVGTIATGIEGFVWLAEKK